MFTWRLQSTLRTPLLEGKLSFEITALLFTFVVSLLLQPLVDLSQVEVSHRKKGF